MKYLYLHNGFGKTGSSALQSWLANNVAALARQGFSYTNLDDESLNYRVSSGNAQVLAKFLAGEVTEKKLLATYFAHGLSATIISSEVLGLDAAALKRLNEFCGRHGLSLKVVFYVRNCYEFLYSAFVQAVKRHCYLGDFRDFVAKTEKVRHVERARRIVESGTNYHVIHYDAVKRDVVRPFCAAVGADYAQLGSLQARTVNRTLTSAEIAVVQFFTRISQEFFGNAQAFNYSALVSDWLVNGFPEKRADLPYSATVIGDLREKFVDDLLWFNRNVGERFAVSLELHAADAVFADEPLTCKQPLDLDILRTVAKFLARHKGRLGVAALGYYARRFSEIDSCAAALLLYELTDKDLAAAAGQDARLGDLPAFYHQLLQGVPDLEPRRAAIVCPEEQRATVAPRTGLWPRLRSMLQR
ncbi:hypothetical protein [Pseudomonas sp. N040]|uniref:hypothetical protein n=1 Tax=Pseudomonas sp. N040 TaxID=2785325 RepID=UPI0018A2F2FE|nr:hypothetical protein [Pseudomonas sp. N040]MBF7731740.1 hypothetical protein [Pseudomonas sp. N040]MBW7015384.1 hypothetical protein [Pseudomonas sp. N040]